MKNVKTLRLAELVAIGVFAVLLTQAPRAEVAARTTDGGLPRIVIMAGGTGTDPIPHRVWDRVRTLTTDAVLNESGETHGDGAPDISWRGSSGNPSVAWSFWNGAHDEIVVSEWDGTAWSAAQAIAPGADDQLDPRIFVCDNAAAYVTWWTAGSLDRVFLSSRAPGSQTWSQSVEVTGLGESGRHPSVVFFNGSVRVAYEKTSGPSGGQTLVVATQATVGSFIRQETAQSPRNERIDPILHVLGTRLWVDWKHDGGVFGFEVFSPVTGWSPSATETYADGSWIGDEMTRQRIRWRALSQ